MAFAIGIVDPVLSDQPLISTIVNLVLTEPATLAPLTERKVFLGFLRNIVSVAGDVHATHTLPTVPPILHGKSLCVPTFAARNKVFVGPALVPMMTTIDDITEVPTGTCLYPKVTGELTCPTAITNKIFVGPI